MSRRCFRRQRGTLVARCPAARNAAKKERIHVAIADELVVPRRETSGWAFLRRRAEQNRPSGTPRIHQRANTQPSVAGLDGVGLSQWLLRLRGDAAGEGLESIDRSAAAIAHRTGGVGEGAVDCGAASVHFRCVPVSYPRHAVDCHVWCDPMSISWPSWASAERSCRRRPGDGPQSDCRTGDVFHDGSGRLEVGEVGDVVHHLDTYVGGQRPVDVVAMREVAQAYCARNVGSLVAVPKVGLAAEEPVPVPGGRHKREMTTRLVEPVESRGGVTHVGNEQGRHNPLLH